MAVGCARFFAVCLAVATPPVAQAQTQAPVDPVSGHPIPVLPGQFVLRTQTGCVVIADAPFASMANFRWNGPCRYGVVHGAGVWQWDNKQSIDALEYGYRKFSKGDDNEVELRRTGSQDWEHLTILARDVRDPEFEIPRGTFHDKVMVEYKTVHDGHFIQRSMLFRRTSCGQGDETGDIPKDIAAFVMKRYNFTKEEAQNIDKYCRASLKRLYDGHFDNYNFGFYYHASVNETDQLIIPDDGGSIASQYKGARHSRLCANLTSPNGCEAAWQPMLAEFVSRFDQMKAEEPARTAQARAEMRERFAPLKVAWARKAAALAAKP